MTILDSAGATINDSDVELIRKMFPGIVDDDNQPLPENIPTEEEQNAPSQPQFFTAWEHSGSCFCCLEGGCKTKPRINFNTNVKPTVEQLFEMFFFQTIYYGNHHSSSEQVLARGQASSSHIWRVPLLAWPLVSYGNNQWSR